MSTLSKSLLVAAGTLAIGLGAMPSASAATVDSWYFNAPGDSCQLSVPTIDTAVRPRANGFRNEGATSQFVICGWGTSRQTSTIYANLMAESTDGVAHSMSCTYTVRNPGYTSPVTYISKTLNVPASGITFLAMNASDLGGTAGDPFGNADLSITCILPPNVSITHLESRQRMEVGA